MSQQISNQPVESWWLRFVKGMFIGSGFILPGISGGALAAIFGLYERIIRFLANLTEDFIENVKFFLPVGFGALTGIAILSWGISYLLGNFETMIVWFFIGAIIGTAPALWHEAGIQGRETKDIVILVVSFVFGFLILHYGSTFFTQAVEPSFGMWMVCGLLIALGVLVPGLSPSNFILYLGLYQAMADGFKRLDLSVLIPIGLGGLLTVVTFSKLIEYIFNRYYPQLFHFIVGIVLASTVAILPPRQAYAHFTMGQYLICAVLFIFGTLLGWWMAQLESKYVE